MSAWTDLQNAVAKRLGEPDIMTAPLPVGEIDIPYYTSDLIERKLFEISNQKLREVPSEELESIGSPAVVTSFGTSPLTLPTGTVKIVSVTIQPIVTSANYVPTDPKEPAAFFQTMTVDPNISTNWTVYEGALQFTGFDARLVTIIEQPLSVWQSTPNILPAAYDEERIDWVVKQLLISDWIPSGMI